MKLVLNLDKKHTFNSIEKFREWKDKEAAAWQILSGQNTGNLPGLQVPNSVYNSIFLPQFNAFNTFLARIPNQTDEEIQKQFELVKQTAETAYIQKKYFVSDSPIGIFISEKAKDSPIIGAYLSYYLSGYFGYGLIPQINFNAASMAALILSANFRSGNSDSAKALIKSLESSYADFSKNISDSQQKFEEKISAADDVLGEANTQLEAAISTLTNQKEKFSEFKDNVANEWETLKETYNDKLSLKAPAEYWTSQKKRFAWSFSIFGTLSVGLTTAFLVSVYYLVATTLNIPFKDISVEKYLLTIIFISFSIWIIRIFVKLFLSSFHLFTEAGQKIVIINTYLALLNNGKIEKADLTSVLDKIFAPIHSGVIKEPSPTTVLESIIRQNIPKN